MLVSKTTSSLNSNVPSTVCYAHFEAPETQILKCIINGTKYSRMEQVKFFKGCLLKISLGPFLNILSQIIHGNNKVSFPYTGSHINSICSEKCWKTHRKNTCDEKKAPLYVFFLIIFQKSYSADHPWMAAF